MISIDGVLIAPTMFPDGTSQVWNLSRSYLDADSVGIGWEFTHEAELIHLAQLKMLLDFERVEAQLYLDYLPYGRQDKAVTNTSTFALRTFARILNAMRFKRVRCMDPHSICAEVLIKNFEAEYPIDEVTDLFVSLGADYVCYPDFGAVSRYGTKYKLPYMSAEKTRDQHTGQITDYKLCGSANGKKILIVDDICDGGATFIKLAKLLFADGAKSVNMFVTHGIFSKGLKPIRETGIDRIFTIKGEAQYSSMYDAILYTPRGIKWNP